MARSLHTAAHRELVAAVKALRKAAGLNQRELADRVGREQNFIARIETGQRRIDLVEWITLCDACDVDPATEIARLVRQLTAHVTAGSRPKSPSKRPKVR